MTFSHFATIADIAGGRGHLLRAVLDTASDASGLLFESPEVVAALDVPHERLEPVVGDFFVDGLPPADAFLLMEILHDWADDQCVQILQAIRRVAAPGATLLVLENLLTEDGEDPRGCTLDVIMLAVTGGRERTSCELQALFDRAGFGASNVIPTDGPLSIVETTAGDVSERSNS